MKESTKYLNFFKQYFLILLGGLLVGLVVAGWFYLQAKPIFVAERLYQFNYTLENASIVEKEADQAVVILRSEQLKEQLGLQETTLVTFKPAPFAVLIQAKSANAEQAVFGLTKIGSYFSNTYLVNEIGTETFYLENKSILKNIMLGILGGLGVGLLIALTLAYFRNF